MRPALTRTPLTRAVVALGTATALAASGCSQAPRETPPDADPPRVLARPGALGPFEDCEQLRRSYVRAALRHVGPYGWDGGGLGPMPLTVGRAQVDAQAEVQAGSPEGEVRSSETGTNVQEAGVDEPDTAKVRDGLLAHTAGERLLLTDVSGPRPRRLGALRLGPRMYGAELLLVGNRVVLVQPEFSGIVFTDLPRFNPGPATTRLLVVDVADPTRPHVVGHQTFSGALLSMRQHEDVVRLVTATAMPDLPFSSPDPRKGVGRGEAARENRALVRQTQVSDWLPTIRGLGHATKPLVDCADVLHPSRGSGASTVTVTGFAPDHPYQRTTTAVTTDGGTAYSSADSVWVTTPDDRGRIARTRVHQLSLDGVGSSYVASGEVVGSVRDRWSMDEHEGVLRMAVSTWRGPRSDNGVVTLSRSGDRLIERGRVEGLGRDQDIQAVRWFDDSALVVTFRRIDPLHVVDLRDPDRPRATGRLRLPGYSGYLHPVGLGLVVGVGQDVDRRGDRGAQVSLFDVRDPLAPRRVGHRGFGDNTYALVAEDPHAFTWLGDLGGLTPITDWTGESGATDLLRVRVVGDRLLVRKLAVPALRGSWATPRSLPLGDDRVAVVAGRRVALLTLT